MCRRSLVRAGRMYGVLAHRLAIHTRLPHFETPLTGVVTFVPLLTVRLYVAFSYRGGLTAVGPPVEDQGRMGGELVRGRDSMLGRC